MLVLGKHSDDKGTQLENLTFALLTAKGYKNLCRSWIGPGGEEVDVQGEYETPLLAGKKLFKLLCECKAYKGVVNLPDWLKFCGKVFVAQQTSSADTHGCFIALSGVNGNVRGSYDELREHKAAVELVTGDDLLILAREVCPYIERKSALEVARRATDRIITGSEVAYYEGQIYWLLLFEHETYTVLKPDGKPLSDGEADTLRPMIEASQPLTTYVNLHEEAQARERARAAQTEVIARLMVAGGKASVATVTQSPEQAASTDLSDASQRLVNSGVIATHEDGELWLPDTDYTMVAAIFRQLFSGPCPVTPLGCEWYDDHINPCLLDEVRNIQGGMTLSASAAETALRAMRYSPTALRLALQPIDVIVNGREQMGGRPLPELLVQAHEEYFLKVMFDSLQMDFTHPGLSNYFYAKRGVRELELRGSHILKSEIGVCLQHDYRQRHIHGFISGVEGRTFRMLALNSHPEPWETPAPSADQPSDSPAGPPNPE